MKLKYAISSLVVLVSTSFNSLQAQNPAELFLVDQGIDASALKDQFNISKDKADLKVFPRKEIVDRLVGQEDFAKDWDELKKDIFFMDLKIREMSYLTNKYPEISNKKIIELKNKIGEF